MMFKKNEGVIDRSMRVTLGLALLPIGLVRLGGMRGRKLGVLFAGLGVMGLITGITGVSALYGPLGFSTVGKEKALLAKCSSMMAGCHREQSNAAQSCCSHQQSTEETCHQKQ